MPHVIVKMFPGRSQEQKQQLCHRIMEDLVEIAGCEKKSVSVAIEEIPVAEWAETVYKPDIEGKKDTLYITPGYTLSGD